MAQWHQSTVFLCGLIVATTLVQISARAGQPVDGRVVWVEGTVTTKATASQHSPRARNVLEVDDLIANQETLFIARGASLHVMVNSLVLASATGPGRFRLTHGGFIALDNSGALVTELNGVEFGSSTMNATWGGLPDHDGVEDRWMITPRDTTTPDTRPRFQWKGMSSNTRYTFQLWRVEGGGKMTLVERWRGLRHTQHRTELTLEKGRLYRWQIETSDESKRVRESAWFMVSTNEEKQALRMSTRALDKLVSHAGAARPALEVLRARLLSSYGRLEEAEHRMRGLARLYPEHKQLNTILAKLTGRKFRPLGWFGDIPFAFGVKWPG